MWRRRARSASAVGVAHGEASSLPLAGGGSDSASGCSWAMVGVDPSAATRSMGSACVVHRWKQLGLPLGKSEQASPGTADLLLRRRM